MDVNSLLDQAKEACGVSYDKDLAPRLGVRPSAISNYRKGVSHPDAVVCATLAGLTGVPLARVLGVIGEARAISREEKAVWRKLAATAMALCLAVGFALPHKAQAAVMGFDKSTVYTLCEIMDRPNPSLRLFRMAMAGPLARLLPAPSVPGQG
ncbi:helix-turn-helix domain-containing protein [Stenotrophomonas maltophilia]|nr:helix-turn-helix domain-containing protein [Stenotrophomonas maltophilia]